MGRTLLVSVILYAACGGASTGTMHHAAPEVAATELAAASLGLMPGEAMAFEVRMAGVLAGEAALAVGQPGLVDGRRAITVRSRIASAGAVALVKHFVDEATTVLDMDTARPVSMTADMAIDSNAYHAELGFDGGRVDVTYQKKGAAKPVHQRYDFGNSTCHDAHSAMAAVRTWQSEPGASRTLWVMGGRRAWRADVTFVGGETLGTSVGNRAALRLQGTAYRLRSDRTVDAARTPRTFTVWISDDGDRVPLRVVANTELGDVVIELVDYQRP